jgi:cytochrome b561
MSVSRYTNTAIGLHWLMFLLIAWGFSIGLSMVDLPLSPAKLKYFSWHKWIGVTVFLLAVARIVWRVTHTAPPLPATMPSWQRKAAALSHLLLYGLIVVVPLSGWIYSSAAGLPTVYLGLVHLPDLLAKDKALADELKSVHYLLNTTLAVIVVLHGAAAIKHQFVDRDGLLARMWPAWRTRKEPA